MPLRSLKAATAAFAMFVGLSLLSGCDGQEQNDPFEIAKDHVWGDFLRGCAYQKLDFTENSMVYHNSEKIINDRRSLGLDRLVLNKKQVEKIQITEIKNKKFVLLWGDDGSKLEFTLHNNQLIRTGYFKINNDSTGAWFDVVDTKSDNGGVFPIKYKVCE